MENGEYATWATLFENHCQAYMVHDHLTSAVDTTLSTAEKALWSRLDALVRQWIYSTISTDLLHTILEPKQTAKDAWERLEGLFQDNKHSRAVYVGAGELKKLAGQLSNVGAPVTNQRLVLQLISGLNESYDGIATILQQSNPLPHFYEARSRLILEETRKSKHATAAGTALYSASSSSDQRSDNSSNSGGGRNSSRKNNN
ncbi:uncharacterized protein LOC141620494 [Silene latifolia]|uniref:uncharacterized protein LOC141620494 n=1 Tax=Silene latifolia TaxID=37657 RepID=UPI003D778867